MNVLRLEELESRALLSGGFLAPRRLAPPPMPSEQGMPGPAMFADHPMDGNFGRPGAPEWAGPAGGMPLPAFETDELVVVIVTIERMPPPQHDPNTSGPDLPGILPVATPDPKAPADNNYVVAAADVTATYPIETPRAISQTPIVLNPAINAPIPALEVAGPIAAQPAVRAARPGDAVMLPGPAWLTQLSSPGGTVTPAAEDDEPIELDVTPSAQPVVQPALLAALPSLDVAALGRGLQQFVGELERAGEHLIGNGGGLRPWLVAAAAAATACEIARRQWARGQPAAGIPKAQIKLSDI